MKSIMFIGLATLLMNSSNFAQNNPIRGRCSDFGIEVGQLEKGPLNMITDVEEVRVGHFTLINGDHVRTGITAILPHSGNIFQQKIPAAMYCFNSFGKLAGYTQVEELGNIETPIMLTNTLSVGTVVEGVVAYTLQQEGNENVLSVNAVVAETNDGYLNDIRGQHIQNKHVYEAINKATSGLFEEGCVGAGTGTTALGFKGGIGSSSRIISIDGIQYTLGVLVQTNFGQELYINGIPVTSKIKNSQINKTDDGSCVIVIATDAPLSVRNLKRLAKRAFIGMGRTTNVMSNSSGDYAIAFSTAYKIPYQSKISTYEVPPLLVNSAMTYLFMAVEEATQEAIYNSLFMATTMSGKNNRTVKSIPVKQVLEIINK